MVGVGRPPRHTNSKGTAVKKSSQIQPVGATALPEQVTVAISEIAENMQEGLLALAVGAGLQVMAALMEADVTALVGPKGRHDAARTAVRHGRERGSVTLGGRRVSVTRPRVRVANGSGELPVASYELFTSTEILGKIPGVMGDGSLRGSIMGVATIHRWPRSGNRANRDDLSGTLLLHDRGNRVARIDGPEQVHRRDKL